MNVYDNPEAFDLTPIAEIDLTDASYEFDILAVWRHKDGRLLTASDSGCSCPSPFEDYQLDDLDPVNIDELDQEVRNSRASLTDRERFMRAVIEAVKAAV